MNIAQMAALAVAILGVLLLVLAWGETQGAEWNTVGQGVASVIVFVLVFAIAAAAAWNLIKRR